MTIVNRERYSCSAKRERGTCDSPAAIKADELEARVLAGLRRFLIGRDELIDEFAAAYRDEVERLRKSRSRREADISAELSKVERGIERCLVFITEGDGDPNSVAAKLTELEARKKALTSLLAEAASVGAVQIHPNVAELYRRKVSALQELLTEDATRYEAMELIRNLIDRIEVRPGAKRGEAEVKLVGVLAQLLDFACSDDATTASGERCRVLVVAGVGFEPTTFRL